MPKGPKCMSFSYMQLRIPEVALCLWESRKVLFIAVLLPAVSELPIFALRLGSHDSCIFLRPNFAPHAILTRSLFQQKLEVPAVEMRLPGWPCGRRDLTPPALNSRESPLEKCG